MGRGKKRELMRKFLGDYMVVCPGLKKPGHFLWENNTFCHCEPRARARAWQSSLHENLVHFEISSYRSLKSGLLFLMRSVFFFLEPAFICFSLFIARFILVKVSK